VVPRVVGDDSEETVPDPVRALRGFDDIFIFKCAQGRAFYICILFKLKPTKRFFINLFCESRVLGVTPMEKNLAAFL
jgi:hypothetical protein